VNAGEFSVRNQRVIFVGMVFVLLGGFVAYQRLGRLEDPEFTIKEALFLRILAPVPRRWPKRSRTRSKVLASNSGSLSVWNRSHFAEDR
jgi:hypothetical protein